MMKPLLHPSPLLVVPLLILFGGCSDTTVPTQAPESDFSINEISHITGTWRRTDGSAFVLINETQIAFYSPLRSIDNFYDYDYDGKNLVVYDSGALITSQLVELEGSRMTLTPLYGEGYDGVYQRTGGF